MQIEKEIVTALSGIVGIQQYLVGLPGHDTIAERILKSADLPRFRSDQQRMLTLPLTQRELKSAIYSTGAAGDPLVPGFKPPADYGTRRTLTLRELIPAFPTINGAIEIPVKTAATNNAAVQTGGSPTRRDGGTLGESAYTFTTSLVPVETVGHWIPVSNQIFEDSGSLDSVINTELLYGLGLAVETQLLNGTGTNGQLQGLVAKATAYSGSSPTVTGKADIIRAAIRQLEIADFAPTAILLNPIDSYLLDVAKATTSDKTYTAGQPRMMGEATVWGVPVVVTNSIAAGSFLVADFGRACILFNRQQAAVEIARHDGSNFTKGMLTLRAVERLALVVTNPTALVKGSL